MMTGISACHSGEVTITNGDLQIRVDNRMRMSVNYVNTSLSKCYWGGYLESDALLTAEFTASQFKLTSVEQNGSEWTLVGVYDKNGYTIEKHQKITVPDNHPGMAFFETKYVNTGDKSVALTGWKSNEVRLLSDEPVWSFQPSSTAGRKDWILEVAPDFYQQNYLGMNNSDYGGGMPIVDLWRKNGGVAIGLVEPTLKMVSLPVEWLQGENYASAAITYEMPERLEFAQGDEVATFNTFVCVHTGDFYNPLNGFARVMEEKGMEFPVSPAEAYEPVWCAWGYERTFTMGEVIGTLDKVRELGFKWVDVDDGYQIAEGDWETNDRFPRGDADMRRLTDAIHARGMKAKLWWAPLAADPGSHLLSEHPEMMLVTEDGTPEQITWWDSYYLSPVNPQTEKHTNELLERFLVKWNLDGLKLDGQHLNCCMPDHNPASELEYPAQSAELMPTYFKHIFDETLSTKPHAVVQFCPCGCAYNFFMIPYMNQAVASDPTSSRQIRMKRKALGAINPNLAYYADHVELSDGGDDFGTQVGIGGVVGSKFTWPRKNPNVEGDGYLLTGEKEKLYKKWVGIYNEQMLSTGDYLNLYDIAFDKPETHVISKEGKMYYAFYADKWDGGEIELRGLENRSYIVREYTTEAQRQYTIDGANPVITPVFERNYLIEVYYTE
jgi:alpha-galactosidase